MSSISSFLLPNLLNESNWSLIVRLWIAAAYRPASNSNWLRVSMGLSITPLAGNMSASTSRSPGPCQSLRRELMPLSAGISFSVIFVMDSRTLSLPPPPINASGSFFLSLLLLFLSRFFFFFLASFSFWVSSSEEDCFPSSSWLGAYRSP